MLGRTRHAMSFVTCVVLMQSLLAAGAPLDDFRAMCAQKAAAAQQAGVMTVVGKDGWLFFDRELRHLSVGVFWGENATKVTASAKPESADPLPAILDFKRQLDRAGVELILIPVPAKAAIYPEKVGDVAVAAGERVDSVDHEFYELLRAQRINVIDLGDHFLKQR